MCGFVGVRRFDGGDVDERALDGLADSIVHRGPDGAGLWVCGPVGLAHRRLAVIDPTGSAQPMASNDSQMHIAFNGEILNYRQMRRRCPYPYRTNGDTEVLLALHQRFGTDAIDLLRGQFAYAIHDSVSEETLLVRDRMGVLPLYYVQTSGWVAFASEAKALLPLLPAPRVDVASLDAYLRRRAVPAPDTLVEGVRKLPPGHYARIDASGALRVHRYWTPPEHEHELDDATAHSRVRTALDRAVEENLVADVPVGAYLSGGLDSSLVTALAARRCEPGTLHTFNAEFGDGRVDEGQHARSVSGALNTLHHRVHVDAATFERQWGELSAHRDAPLSEPADVAVHALAVAAAQHVKVVLSGEGADELFGGYPKYRLAQLTQLGLPGTLCRAMGAAERHVPSRLRRTRIALRSMSAPTPEERIEAWFSPFVAAERRALLGPVTARPAPSPPASDDPLRRMLLADCGPWLSDNLLERGDRMTMAASVELRPPFLDHRLVELALALPARMKIRHGQGKWILREVARELLPADIARRSKSGFRVPLDRWFRGDLRSLARDTLLSPDAFVAEVLDRRAIESLLDRHDDGRSNEDIRVWTLLSLEIWHRATLRDVRPAGALR